MRAFAKTVFASAAIFVIGNIAHAGNITGTVTGIPASVNLTTEGTSDWAHWGLSNANSFDHKATGGTQISNVTTLGSAPVKAQLTDSPSRYSWSDGNPTASFSSTPTGIYINNFTGTGRGFQFTAPADTTSRTLEVFLGEFDASGTLEATLSDGSAATFTNTLTGGANQTVQGLYTLNYSANSPSQTLTVKWTETDDLGQFDNVTLQAAALKLAAVPEPATAGLLGLGAAILLASSRKRSISR